MLGSVAGSLSQPEELPEEEKASRRQGRIPATQRELLREKRSNQTHESRTDRGPKLARIRGMRAMSQENQSALKNALVEN